MKTIKKAIKILQTFSFEKMEYGISELSRETGFAKATTHRICRTLVDADFLVQTPEKKKYRLGMELFKLGKLAIQGTNLRDIVAPELKRLSQKFNCASHLAILDRLNVVYLDKETTKSPFTFTSHVGMVVPGHVTALGKILLAHKDLGELRNKYDGKEMESFTKNTITDPDRLLEKLCEYREQGYAVDNEEATEGLVCFAVPILDHSESPKAAISISKYISRIDEIKEGEIVKSLKDSAKTISHDLLAHKGESDIVNLIFEE